MAQSISSSLLLGGVREIPPMAEMNTTPLIDVMLVLLIMFIITVPMQRHQVTVALPQPTMDTKFPIRLKNELVMDRAGSLSWNGLAVNDTQLAGLLAEVASRTDQPEVHFRPDAAVRYNRVDQILALAARSRATGFGFVGNEQYKSVF